MYSSKVLMNELSCRKVSDLASAEAGLGAIAAPMAPRPASLRNPRRDVTSILRTPLAPPGQHLVDHRRGGAHVIGGIGQCPQFVRTERAGHGGGLQKHIEQRSVGLDRDAA